MEITFLFSFVEPKLYADDPLTHEKPLVRIAIYLLYSSVVTA